MKPDHVEVPVDLRVDTAPFREALQAALTVMDKYLDAMEKVRDVLADALSTLEVALVAEPAPPASDWREFPLSVYISDAVRTDPERYTELLVRMQRDLHGAVHQADYVPVSQDVVAYESDEAPGLWRVAMTIKAYGHTDEGDDA